VANSRDGARRVTRPHIWVVDHGGTTEIVVRRTTSTHTILARVNDFV